MSKLRIALLLMVLAAAGLATARAIAQEIQAPQELQLVESPPPFGTFYLAGSGVPYPFDPFFGQLPMYHWRPGVYIVDDSQVDYVSLRQQSLVGEGLTGGEMSLSGLPSPCNPCSTNGSEGGPKSWGGNYSHTNVLWLEITSAVMTNSTATFVIHTSETNGVYDLFSTTNLARNVSGLNQTNWIWLMRSGAGQTNLALTNIWPIDGWFQLGTMLDGDSDELTTAYENLVSHTNPDLWDTDGDLMPDGWETLHGLNPMTNDSMSDPDGDGLTNLQEYFGGTNPHVAGNVAVFLVVPKPGSTLP